MHLQLDARGGIQVLKIKNTHDRKKAVRLRGFAWRDSDDASNLDPSDDLLVMPPIFEVEPGSEQIVRIGLRQPAATETEQTYRILISEVPSELDSSEGVNFNLEINLPIFIRPEGAKADPVWSLSDDGERSPALILSNQGNAHIKVLSVALEAPDGGSEAVDIGGKSYLFGGEERRWPLKTTLAELKGPIAVRAQTTAGPLEAVIGRPDG